METLSKAKAKFIHSLLNKKNRSEENLFIAEGEKILLEIQKQTKFTVSFYALTEIFLKQHPSFHSLNNVYITSPDELEKIGSLSSNKSGIAILNQHIEPCTPTDDSLILILDTINDPGNLGTIIRIADWYNIKNIYCTEGTADVYNPKTINSSKGSFLRVNVHYPTEREWKVLLRNRHLYAADMHGKNIHEATFKNPCGIIMGNESHGIGDFWNFVKYDTITIPKSGRAESLNVAIATAIICDNYYRKNS